MRTLFKEIALRERINVQTVLNVPLVWLDNNLDENSADYQNTIAELRRVVNSLNTFTDVDQCASFLTDIDNKKVYLIISGALCQKTIPLIHDVDQLGTIFICCRNKIKHEQWAKNWSKIKGVFTEISHICQALKQTAQQCEQNAISISFIATSDIISRKNLDQLDPSFMYTQILKEILLTIKFEQEHITEFIEYCRDLLADSKKDFENVNKLEQKYRDETPIWWYTCECCLYPILNRALRLMDVNVIIKMGFFLSDLHRHIEQLHKEQFGDHNSDKSFIVYRGQGISKTDFDQLTKTKGGLMCFNSFLSTSRDRAVSGAFAESNIDNPDLVGILFVMAIDPTKSTTPFASITDVSYYKNGEDEVLFSMHTVFRIGEITSMDESNRIFQVNLILTSDNDKDLRALTDHIREEIPAYVEGWYRLGLLLNQIGQFDKAEQVYEILLKQRTYESEKAAIYHQLGSVKYNQGKYTQAITFYEKSLEIEEKRSPPNHLNVAHSNSTLGNVYQQMGDYSKALSYHIKALQSYKEIHPSNHPDLAGAYNNIGSVYYSMDEYSKALSFHEKALEIKQQSLPPNHPDLAGSYSNIGTVYDSKGDYSKALLSYGKALEIRQQSLPSNHPHVALSYNNIGLVYNIMGEYSKALSSHEKALAIQQQSLPPNHPDLAMCYNNIGLLYENMGNKSKAHSFCERAVNILQISLPANHPDLQKYRKNLDRVKNQL